MYLVATTILPALGVVSNLKGQDEGSSGKSISEKKFHCLWKSFFFKVIDEISIKRKRNRCSRRCGCEVAASFAVKGSLKGQEGPKALQVTADDIGMYTNGQGEVYIRRDTPKVQISTGTPQKKIQI